MVGVRLDIVKAQIGKNFTLKIDYYFSDTDERNVVVEQSIPEGTSYDPAKKPELVLKVCSGPANVGVPAYYGLDQKSYLAQLNELNIKYKVTQTAGSAAAGTVIGTSIYPGNTINVKNGDVLIVYVSDGTVTTTQSTTSQSEETPPEQTETKPQDTQPPEQTQPPQQQQQQQQGQQGQQ